MPKSGGGAYKWVWGKTQDRWRYPEGQRGWNPLLAHLLDTGATARELWDRYLPDNVRTVLTEAFGGGDAATARAVVPFLAALHDLGKAAPAFLRQFDQRDTRSHLRKARQVWEEEARSHGVPLPATWEGLYWAHHQHITAATLPRLLGCDCPVANGQRCRAPEHQGLYDVAYALGGHHGHVPGAETVGTAAIARGGANWDKVRADLVEVTAAMLGVDLPHLAAAVAPVKPAALIHLTGLVILSDWIASNDDRYPYADLADSDEAWWQAAQNRAKDALTALCLDRWKPTKATWQQLWPGTEPRPVQAAVMDLMPPAGPTLVVVEAPPASGKTRLALWCAHYLASRNGYQGLYIAMPTKADTGRIAEEVKQFMQAAVADGDATLAVVQADAIEQQIVYDLIDAERPAQEKSSPLDALAAGALNTLESDEDEHDPAGTSAADEHRGRDRAVMDPWYLNRCVGLMATFGVGTIDEVMLAAQPSKHWMLRLFGLSCKTVVIDEAHAYELYQQDLLGTTVQWLADAGSSVVVLSNALPAAVRTALTASWCAGLQVEAADAGDEGPVTVVDAAGHVRRGGPLPADAPQNVTTLRLRRQEDPAGLASELLDKARSGGCMGVVRNRVDKAVALYRAALANAAAHGWDESEILLLHEQFQTHQQKSTEERIRSLLGDRAASRPHRLLVITTQGTAQAVDFDFMVSDLAPVDLLIERMGNLHRNPENTGQRRTWCRLPQLDVLFQADPQEPDLPLVEPPRLHPGRGAGNLDGLAYAPYALAATFRTLRSKCDQQGRISLCLPRDAAGLIASVYETRQTGEGTWATLLDRTWNAWLVALAGERLAADDNGVRPYVEGHPATVGWLISGELNGAGERGGVDGLRALPRLSIPPVNAVCLYQHGEELTYDAEGKLRAKFYSDRQLKKGVPPAVERQVKRNLLLHTVSMPGNWFEGNGRLPAPKPWPRRTYKPLDRWNVLLFDATGACVFGLAGRVHYDPATGLRRL
ncbi:CRISPR-associated endonuclease Cas3'' [Streptomyces katrae]|uniref:CRISPR-associated endonuclease Cas3'' n=1 Tax=Streptomyces katrae TaxID=68223 RepID=UPI0004C26066|nr:CRISPR-associated endonuclease Cas3'' [Streptomyces katrae]